MTNFDSALQPREYPEGEYQPTNGPCEGDLTVAAQPVGIVQRLQDLQVLIQEGKTEAAVRVLKIEIKDLIDAPEWQVTCEYEGVVDAEWQGDRKGNGDYFWTCPWCGAHNNDSREAGDDDPDL